MNTVVSQPVTATARPRVVLVSNNPAPYRIPVFNTVADVPDFELTVLFSTEREPTRQWDLSTMRFQHAFMKSFFLTWKETFIHLNTDVLARLRALSPDMVILTGFNPTNLLAFLYARWRGCRLGLLIDGTDDTEARLSGMHRWVRKRIYPHLDVAFGPSEGTFRLYDQYGVPRARMHKSHLCANNHLFQPRLDTEPEVDFIFCGRFTQEKHPDFALRVASAVAGRLGRTVSVLMVGSGPMDDEVRALAAQLPGLRVEFPGFAKQHELPAHYARCAVSLFPTAGDAWGVVANESCASGVPVVVTPHAGVAGELVVDGVSGFVRPLDLQAWTDVCVTLVTDHVLRAAMARQSIDLVSTYTFDNAAQGLIDGIRQGLRGDA